MRPSPWGAHGSFHGNTISDGSHRPATVVDAPAGSKLGSDLEMASERLSIQNSLSFYPWILSASLLFILSFSPHPLTSHLLTLYECILSCSLFLSLLSSPRCHPSPPTHDSLSLWHCRGNLILDCLEFPRIPFGVAPGTTQRQTSAVEAKSSKHRLIIPPCSFLLHWSCLLLFSKWIFLPVKLALQDNLFLSNSESIELCKHFKELPRRWSRTCFGLILNTPWVPCSPCVPDPLVADFF